MFCIYKYSITRESNYKIPMSLHALTQIIAFKKVQNITIIQGEFCAYSLEIYRGVFVYKPPMELLDSSNQI